MDGTQPEVMPGLRESAPPTGSGDHLTTVLNSFVQSVGQFAPGTHAGISVATSTGTFETVAGTDPLVFVLDDLQYDLDEGPCLTAIREGHTVIVDDAESEHRWPRFMSHAIDLGLRSHLGVPIPADGNAVAGLNMYSTIHASTDASRLSYATLFAEQAAMAMSHARREKDLLRALETSRTIGTAVGLVMERFNLDDQGAFAHLVGLSQRSNVKLRDLAAHMVKQSNDLRHWVPTE